jgi:hypothetical protein
MVGIRRCVSLRANEQGKARENINPTRIHQMHTLLLTDHELKLVREALEAHARELAADAVVARRNGFRLLGRELLEASDDARQLMTKLDLVSEK